MQGARVRFLVQPKIFSSLTYILHLVPLTAPGLAGKGPARGEKNWVVCVFEGDIHSPYSPNYYINMTIYIIDTYKIMSNRSFWGLCGLNLHRCYVQVSV